MRKLLNIELGRMSPEEYKMKPRRGLAVILDNVRSAHNVGSAFRTADSFGADFIALCGICAVPPSAEIHKSALGAEETVEWRHFDDTLEAVRYLRAMGYRIAAVEQAEGSLSLEDFRPDGRHGDGCPADEEGPEGSSFWAFVFGNEVSGVQQEVVDASDVCIEIPQFGTKHSLNVSVSLGVVLWQFTEHFAERQTICSASPSRH